MRKTVASIFALACLAGCSRNEPPAVETVRVLVPVVVTVPTPMPETNVVGDESLEFLIHRMAVAAANIANAETPGYKPLVVTGQDDCGHLVAEYSFTQGAPRTQHRPLDILLNGPGFFRVCGDEGGYLYTRDGRFTRNSDGEMVMAAASQYRLEPWITIPEEATGLVCEPDGMVCCTVTDGTTIELGLIEVFGFKSMVSLQAVSPVLFAETANSGEPEPLIEAARPTFLQYYYEASAVDMAHEQREIARIRKQLLRLEQANGSADAVVAR